MESEKPPQEPLSPSVEIILDHPSAELEMLSPIVSRMISGAVEFVVCDPGIMRSLNWKWRRIDRPTDVLTFDLSSGDEDAPAGVVYVDGRLAPPLREVLERVFHGWLHLNGMTHDTPEDAGKMEALTEEMVQRALALVEGELS